jgi:hypothetical protein
MEVNAKLARQIKKAIVMPILQLGFQSVFFHLVPDTGPAYAQQAGRLGLVAPAGFQGLDQALFFNGIQIGGRIRCSRRRTLTG